MVYGLTSASLKVGFKFTDLYTQNHGPVAHHTSLRDVRNSVALGDISTGTIHGHTANPPLFNCLGSPAASKVPLLNNLKLCAVDPPGAVQVTLWPLSFKKAAVELS